MSEEPNNFKALLIWAQENPILAIIVACVIASIIGSIFGR